MNKIVTLIPARGGSKSIPKKNLVKLAGKPLLQYAIEAAMPVTDEVWISTDDEEIGQFAQQCGAHVLKRPAHLSGDVATTESAMLHFTEHVKFDSLLLLECTSPLITSDDLQGLLDAYHTGMDNRPTVLLAQHLLFKAKILNDTYVLIPDRKRNQDFTKMDYTYTEAGAWITSYDSLINTKDRAGSGFARYYIMPHPNIDIDTPTDLKIAEVIVEGAI